MAKPSVFRKIGIDPVAAQNRLVEGRREAVRIIGAMKEKGVIVELFGSMRKGTPHPNSDIDLLVTDCGALDPAFVMYEIELLSRDIPVDVMILKYVPQRSLACVMESLHEAWIEK